MAVPDRASVLLEMCDAYIKLNKPEQANEIMEQAMTEFQVITISSNYVNKKNL